MASPAERYAAARSRNRREASPAGRFEATLPFELDDFQKEAIDAVASGAGVLVAAPTGSGKTIVGEFAVELALQTGRKAFYTTPIKALSNQKYHDLVARHGSKNVGLLTGDSSVNGEAPIVVMTTEVLRNMMYAGSHTLTNLSYVVMDEVHYLADRFRGAVWEEVIIHLPESVQVVSLSATVSNAEEFGEWLRTVRGNTDVIVSEHRPVPLWQHMMVGRRMMDIFVQEPGSTSGGGGMTRINPELLEAIRSSERSATGWRREDAGAPRGRRGKPHHKGRPVGGATSSKGALPGGTASRAQVIEELDRAGLLPAITFIFSRAGCDAAVGQLLARNTRLIPFERGVTIRRKVEERVAEIGEGDLGVLGYQEFVEGLCRGFAAHHAGMLPLFRELVEELFTNGDVRAVFATETLALGINMPARTVVLEKLVKFNGESHVSVTPAEYTQLTGRAGRRGIDFEGHAVVLHRRGLDPFDVAGLASARTFKLRSSFKPSYNMAVNLVARFGRDQASELLQSSFAQFQADAGVVGLTAELRHNETALAGYAESMACHLGDFSEYSRLRHRIAKTEKANSRRRAASRRSAIAGSLEKLHRGDVIHLSSGRRRGMAVVISGPQVAVPGPDPTVLTVDGQVRRLGLAEFEKPVHALDTLKIPGHFNPRNAKSRKDLAATLRIKIPDDAHLRTNHDEVADEAMDEATASELADLRAAMKRHPCHQCPEREDHARWAARWWKLRADSDDLQRRISGRTNTVAKTFDRICDLLAQLGYLSRDGREVTDQGQQLRRLYTELDLVAAQCLRLGTWDKLDAPSLAAALSMLIHEPRGEEAVEPRMPNAQTAQAYQEMLGVWSKLQDREAEMRLPSGRPLDAGIAWMIHRWAAGGSLEEVLKDSDLSAGDFVRRSRQVIDLLGQVAQAATGDTAANARSATNSMLRGVIAADRLG